MAKYAQTDSIEMISTNITWTANGCYSYMIRNVGNTNVTLNITKVLQPGEWVASNGTDPEIINNTTFRIEFDAVSPVMNGVLYPGSNPSTPNVAFDPTTPNIPKDNRLEIFRSYLTPIK